MRVVALGWAVAVGLAAAPALQAQTYPSKPIKIIVAYPAGQGTDIATRYLADQISRDLGQPIVIDNRPGAGGNVGTDATAKAHPDGYTLTMGTNATHVLNEFLYSKIPFNAGNDFEPVVMVGTFPMVLAVVGSSPLTSARQLVDTVRTTPRGADIALPSTSARLVVELLKERSAVALFGVPYKGSGTAVTDLIGGQLTAIVDTPTSLRPHLQAGKLRALAVTSLQPSALVPGVPAIAEQGYPGFDVIAWNALYAPKGTPAPIIHTLNAAFNKALQRPETRQRLLELGFEPAGGTPEWLAGFGKTERKKWQVVIATAGLKAD
ncbi:tripartite tricarboxylate transporter substrate binding protein [Acidovorax sp. Be4]|uniref:Tripartite tricarboxylate transporter substrate binding protein n=1 Tax=Acidovorax bellezanensis TaxID=2976702 RepID=A0ABT2PJK6_9BURK|nr:tripartite tricarboxylate transporter substrate binding protein [Acidovorax sp. Be4]MCT9810675.1 tripartite tricarboxylate transporter substrate binding protein [Acidovorax sp. Be4]